MKKWAKIKKLGHFIGPIDRSNSPVFLNSVPKAGTNLVERLLILHGYKRNFAVCYNEQNLKSQAIKARRGRFDVGHLFDDEPCHCNGYRTIYLHRALWPCIRSYVNYMFIDTKHPASKFVREGISSGRGPEFIERLVLGTDNPLERPLIVEYQRFFNIDLDRYDLVMNFDEFVATESKLVERLSTFLNLPGEDTRRLMLASMDSQTWTKNSGAIDIFSALPAEFVGALANEVGELDKFSRRLL